MKADEVTRFARPLLVKWLTRGAVWLLTAKFGYDALAAQTDAAEIGNGLAAIACVVIGLLIDRWHHRRDLAEPPK